tara:strand:+ start:374 stop:865 length:492 start_codon:yes stop_codon:yes gene_type:complete
LEVIFISKTSSNTSLKNDPAVGLTSSDISFGGTQHHRFCNTDEFVLFIDQYDCQFIQEADLKPMSLAQAVAQCQDTTVKIIRMDQSNWRGEDVSEEIAQQWLHIHEPEPDTTDKLPDFVQSTDAWQAYVERQENDLDYHASEPTLRQDAHMGAFELGLGKFSR